MAQVNLHLSEIDDVVAMENGEMSTEGFENIDTEEPPQTSTNPITSSISTRTFKSLKGKKRKQIQRCPSVKKC